MGEIRTLEDEISALCGKAKRGDVMAGISVILKLCAVTKVAIFVTGTLLTLKATILVAAPWAAPLLGSAILGMILSVVIQSYANLAPHERQVVAAAVGWMQGRVRLEESRQ